MGFISFTNCEFSKNKYFVAVLQRRACKSAILRCFGPKEPSKLRFSEADEVDFVTLGSQVQERTTLMKRSGTTFSRAGVAIAVGLLALGSLWGLSESTGTSSAAQVHGHASTTEISSTSPITAGPSRTECLTPPTAAGRYGASYLQSLVTSFDHTTQSSVTCLSVFLSGIPNWQAWDHPWVDDSTYGYNGWVEQAPQTRQLVLAVQLIPDNLQDVANPLGWEQACASGQYNSYASTLGNSLVQSGLGNSVIRLGAEMNGVWESDFMGTTVQEQRLWASCFDNEVTALRSASGQHFLIDWNVNACKGDYAYQNYYPGNAFVDIVGIDLYDVACLIPNTRVSFAQLSREQLGLSHFEAFARSQGKPMSLPEWGLSTVPAGDDPAYINGIGATVRSRDFAFETYFDAEGAGKALPLGSKTPNSLVAFQKWFGSAN